MKQITPQLRDYLSGFAASADRLLFIADLYTITLQAGSAAGFATGQQIFVTDLDLPVLWQGNVFASNYIQVSGLKYKSSVGLNVDAQQITIAADETHTIGGAPFLQALQQGLLDGAEIRRERAWFFNFSDPQPLVPIGTMILFQGRVARCDSIGRTNAKVTVESDLTLLKIDMPRNYFSPNCVWTLYDSGCTVNRASFTTSGSCNPDSTKTQINWGGASANHAQGTITFTSGENEGIKTTVKAAGAGYLSLAYPLLYIPASADAFTVDYGCDHTTATCASRFGNLANFRGFPYLPPPQVVTGSLSTTANAGKG